jgi:hypothetical protein
VRALLSQHSCYLLNLSEMPRSKKGRLSGSARKELNMRRADDAVRGRVDGIAFGRVTKIVGAGHVVVAIDSSHGPKELRARIPNILARKGATPITTRDVVAIFVGTEFNPDDTFTSSDHFDINAVLTNKQVYELQKDGVIPPWMSTESADVSAASKDDVVGYEFDYSAVKEEDSDSEKEEDVVGGAGGASAVFSRKGAIHESDDVDIDAI